MKVLTETSLLNFDAWSGAKKTKETIIDNCKVDEFDSLIEDLYPEGLTDTQLNDLLWFEPDLIFESLGISNEEDDYSVK